ncbi:receptor-like protein kinase [Trifolium pratense]|uniref:Receptor-like protein kinase n=1 Tax=Trifolium pratense TaxID=57577 RepID=A0A2K3PLI4_TRIPR|nr:receptor-like protein kinase [Trifolium pratense]
MELLLLFLHLLLFHFPSSSSSSSSSNFLCHLDESSSLLQFKSSFDIVPDFSCDKSLKTATWKNGTDCCSWNGVTCDTISGHVIGLDLYCEGIQENFQNLDTLDLSNNKLNGRVTNWLLETSRSLNLSQNFFTSIDQISRDIGKLNGLDLSFNLLESDLSAASICNLSSLGILNVAHNKFSSIIPECLANLTFLNVLDLQMNKFHGALPSIFSTSLVTLNLYGNQLEGKLPKSLSQCKNLNVLNLGNNKLQDNFPYWLQSLQFLNVLILRDNKLQGPIVNLTFEHPFPSLIIFDISANNFSGLLPKAYLKSFKAMKNVTQVITKDGTSVRPYMQIIMSVRPYTTVQYYDSVTVTMKGTDMAMIKIPSILVSMDLSRNKFEGEIPNVIGELHDLIGLNLSHNRLTGHIPRSMGSLANLEWLDLSSNMLTSQIPAELTDLDFLAFLNLSNNHLVGEIPQGKQFNTFTNDSYEGNLGLCGLPLSKKCGPETELHRSPPSANNIWSEEKFGFGWKPVAIGYGCGFVFGIGLGYFVFLIGKPRWLVMLFGGQPKRRVRRRAREGRTNGPTQMVPMS